MKFLPHSSCRWLRPALAAALLTGAFGIAGCAKKPAASPGGAKKPSTSAPASTNAAVSRATEVAPEAPKSVFTTGPGVMDPFYPKKKPRAGSAPVVTDVQSLLKAGFQGVVLYGGTRIALIHNVVLEQGRSAIIPVRVGDQVRRLNVRCREIEPTAVVLEVQGEPRPIRISRDRN